MMFNGKNVLVAGGTGMIGIPLVEMLVELGANVRISSLDDARRAHKDAEFLERDLTKFENCMEVCKDMDFVFNLLGVKASPGITMSKPASFMYPTVMMEMNMLEAAYRQKVAGYLLTSSIGVYAPAEAFKEEDVWKTMPSPKDWFGGWSKRIGEIQIDAYKRQYAWENLCIVRPANVYGPFDNFDSENAMVVPSLIKRTVQGESPLKVWGDGRAVRDFIHARDVALGMLITAEKMPSFPVNLGSGVGISIRQLVDIILSNFDEPIQAIWDSDKPVGDSVRIMDMSNALSIGFVPIISIEDGVREVIEWYRDNQNLTARRYDVYQAEEG